MRPDEKTTSKDLSSTRQFGQQVTNHQLDLNTCIILQVLILMKKHSSIVIIYFNKLNTYHKAAVDSFYATIINKSTHLMSE